MEILQIQRVLEPTKTLLRYLEEQSGFLHVYRFHPLAWPELRKMWGEKNGGGGGLSYLMISPSTGKQEGGALYYHMPDTQTGRSTVMKTDEWCNALSTEGNEIRCWQLDGQIPGLAFKCFLTSPITWSVNAYSSQMRRVLTLLSANSSFFLALLCMLYNTTEFGIICAVQQVAWDKHFTSNNLSEETWSLLCQLPCLKNMQCVFHNIEPRASIYKLGLKGRSPERTELQTMLNCFLDCQTCHSSPPHVLYMYSIPWLRGYCSLGHYGALCLILHPRAFFFKTLIDIIYSPI